MLSGNILDILDLHPSSRTAVPAREVSRHVGQRVKVFGSPVTERIHHVEHNGEAMMFLTLEDKSETVDVILWPDVYKRFADEVATPGPLEVWGRVTEDWDTFSVEATSIRNVDWSPGQVDFIAASKRLEKSFTVDYSYGDIAA
jgi:DNA polymerase III alpha subunit